jgi:hypothetical protein
MANLSDGGFIIYQQNYNQYHKILHYLSVIINKNKLNLRNIID